MNRLSSTILIIMILMAGFSGCTSEIRESNDDNPNPVVDNEEPAGEPPPVISHPFHGICFSPYMGEQDPNQGSYVSEDQIRERMSIPAPFCKWFRTFGTDHGLEKCGAIAREYRKKTAIGAWLGTSESVNQLQIETVAKR